jgi:monofunctional biosynthetic peptidoglycan transglycosylase
MLNILNKALLVLAIAVPFIILATIMYLYLSLPDVTGLKLKNPKTTALMDQRIREAQRSLEPYRVRQYWVAFDTIPTLLKDIVRICEDAGFYHHHGIDYTELKEAMKKNLEKGKYARGGSTITQQLAKNLYLSTQKRIFRKIKEYFIAKRLEANLSKDRIFYLYLNVIELGPGIFGVQAASRYYFNKNVSELDLEEMIRLAAVIPRPLKIDPRGDHRWLQWKTRWILNTLKKYEYISEGQYRSQIVKFQ